MLMTIVILWMMFGMLRFMLRATWHVTKFFFGVGLFVACPLLFLAAVLLGVFQSMWVPIVICGLIYWICFKRC